VIDGDGLGLTGDSPWSSQNSKQTYSFKVVCNGAIIPHFWVGIRASNTVHFIATGGAVVPFQDFSDEFSKLRPFIPANTLGEAEKSHGYCKPTLPSGGNILEDSRTINRASPCVKNNFCASNVNSQVPVQTIAFGGCYCDKDCYRPENADCCLDATNCMFREGTTWTDAVTYFATHSADCVDGLYDCDGNCLGNWAFNIIGDGTCDDGRRGFNLNCISDRHDFAWDNGDCFCDADAGYFLDCDGTCQNLKDMNPDKQCTCDDFPPNIALYDCSGNCRPVVPTVLCTGLADVDIDCPAGYALVGASSLEEAIAAVCQELPDGCVVDIPTFIGDHVCDAESQYNNEICEWDGGDCCLESCIDQAGGLETNLELCYTSAKDCQDPLYQVNKNAPVV
jgi:hypothetical protein